MTSLEKILAVIKKGWTQGVWARDADGHPAGIRDADACSWCLDGAILLVGDTNVYKKIAEKVGSDYIDWNDTPGRTQDEVVSLLERMVEDEKNNCVSQ